MALLAHLLALVEALRAVLHTQVCSLHLQQGRCTDPAGAWTRTRTHDAGVMALLTPRALFVVPCGTVADAEVQEAQVSRSTGQAVFGRCSGAGGADGVTGQTEAQLLPPCILCRGVSTEGTGAHTCTVVQVVRGGAGGAELGALTGEAAAVAAGAGELVSVQVGPQGTLSVSGHTTQEGDGVQHQALFTGSALVRLRAPAPRTRLMALLALFGSALVERSGGALSETGAFVKHGAHCGAGVTVVSLRPRACATGGVTRNTATLLHVLEVALRTAGPAHSIQHQVEETALETRALVGADVTVGGAVSTRPVLIGKHPL